MATLSFDGETHAELVQKVTRWLQSVEGGEELTHLTAVEAVQKGAELTKDALRVIAAAAPEPVASNDVVKSLTNLGYKATDQTRNALTAGLDSLEEVTGGSVVKRAEETGRTILWQMNREIARQVLKALGGR